MSASEGLQQPIVVAGWEADALVVETTMSGRKMTQCYRLDRAVDKLLVFTTAQVSGVPPVTYRLIYEREHPGKDQAQKYPGVSTE